MLVQRISALAVCSALLVACGTNNVKESASIPVASPLNSADSGVTTQQFITQHQQKVTAQQYALKQEQDAKLKQRQWEQQAAQQRQKWEQEHARRQREAQQRYEEDKKRIARLKYHQKYKQEQMRAAQEKLEAEKLRIARLQYQHKFEAEQKRKEYERKAAEQKRLANQEAARKQQVALAQRQKNQQIRARAQARYQQAQTRAQRVAHNRQRQQPAQAAQRRQPAQQQVAIRTPGAGMFRGAGRYNRLPNNVASKLRLRGVSERGMSAYVRPASGRGPAVLTAAADTPRNPASTMKLVTTYAALGALGPNYQWPTEIYITGPIVRGTLRGDVVIKGYGNPDFKQSDLTRLLSALRSRGINNIAGNLVADTSYFNIPYQHPGAFDGKSGAAYNAQPEALLYQGRGSTYKFRNLSKRVKRHTKRRPRNAGARADLNINLFGAFWKVWVGKMNGGMQGRFRRGTVPRGAQLVSRHHSKPLRHILSVINKKSNNVMARQLLLTIGAKSLGAPGTPGKGAAAVGRFMESRGLNFPELRIENGSGLSRVSRISARNLGEMLVNAYNSPWRNDYMNSLAVLGVDGTLRNRMRKSGLAGRGRFKTGTLRNVRGLAGYVQAANGQTYVLSILHNDRKARTKARKAHDELVKWVYWGPRSNFASR